MTTHRILAVDFGASGGKCFVATLSEKGFQLDEIHRFAHEGVSFYMPEENGELAERTYWDDTLLYHNLIEGLRAYRREVGDHVDSIGIDTWGADGHFITAKGDLLGKVYAYRDHRLDNMVAEVKKRIDAQRIYEITGIHFQPFNVSNQVLWFVQNRPELLLPGTRYFPIPTLFYYYLGGVWKVDSSWASVTQLMDARTRQWSEEILGALGVSAGMLPPIVAPGTIVGNLHEVLAEKVGLNPAPLAAVGAHDTASAFAAAPLENPEKALVISSGTWSLVGKLIPEPITTAAAMQANFSNEGGIGNIRFLKNCMGTWLVQELRRAWRATDGKEMGWEEIIRLTEQAEPFNAFIDVDDLSFYNPFNMEEAIMEYCRRTGQQPPTDRGACLRTVTEGLALKYRQINEELCGVSGIVTEIVSIVGGGCRNALLNQFTANALNLPVQAGPEEATAVGNAMVQAIALGAIRSLPEAQPLIRDAFAVKIYRPVDHPVWDAAYQQFRQIAEKA